MADKTIYYKNNYLRALENWTLGEDSSVADGQITLAAGDYAYVDLSADYKSASLKRSDRRKLKLSVIDANGVIGTKSQFSGSNNLEDSGSLTVNIYGTYCSPESEEYTGDVYDIAIAPNTINYKKYDSSTHKFDYAIEFDMMSLDLMSMRVKLINTSDEDIVITKASLLRSKDISQLGENTKVSLTVSSVEAYRDGMAVYFDNDANPMKCWWIGDSGGLTGINVDNERQITFIKRDELLT